MRKSIQHVLPNPGDIACKYVDDPWSQIVMIRMTPVTNSNSDYSWQWWCSCAANDANDYPRWRCSRQQDLPLESPSLLACGCWLVFAGSFDKDCLRRDIDEYSVWVADILSIVPKHWQQIAKTNILWRWWFHLHESLWSSQRHDEKTRVGRRRTLEATMVIKTIFNSIEFQI